LVRLIGSVRKGPLDRIQRILVHRRSPVDIQERLRRQQPRAGPGRLGGERGKPALHRHPLPPKDELIDVSLDQPGRQGGLPGGHGMPDGVVGQTMLF
jgi:hypothetical protein